MTFPCCHSYWNTSVLHSSKSATQALWCGLALVLSAVLIIVTLICVSTISPFLWKVKSHTQLRQCTWVVCLRTPSVFTHVRQPLKYGPLLSPFSHFSLSGMSDSLQPHGLQHTRLPYPSPTPGACWNSCPLSQWCHPAISSSVIPFSSCPQSLPALESFPMSQFFASGGQSIGVSASTSVLPTNI